MIEIKFVDITVLNKEDQLDASITDPSRDPLFEYITEEEKYNVINTIKNNLSEFINSNKETLLIFKIPDSLSFKNHQKMDNILLHIQEYLQSNPKIQTLFIPNTIDVSCIHKE